MKADRKKLVRLRKLARIRGATKSRLAGERVERMQRVERIRETTARNERFLDEALEFSGMFADQALRLVDVRRRVEEEEEAHLVRLDEELRRLHEKQSRLDERADLVASDCERRDQESYLNEILMQQLAMGVQGHRK